ncbi:MAG: NAD(P)H-hydrate dehydratase [Desulfovibrio sp.]|jgi:NAD(P)H-hydrate epimerase|nr:NAD(P)H-hydrate dehydratase [Desulfovibrio sp.]
MKTDADFAVSLPPLPLPREMRLWDAGAVALGLPESLLMENAGRAAFDVLRRHVPDIARERIWLFMGGGNNGGDAACLARHLLDAGARPLVLHTKPLGEYRGAAARHMRLAKAAGVPFAHLRRRMPDNAPPILVDGLTGAGLAGNLRPPLTELVETINGFPARFVLALDIPSGLDAVTGLPSPVAVKADATVSFAAAKPGLVLPWARAFTGRLHVRGIGIPARVRSQAPCAARLLDARCLACLPQYAENSYKNSFGHVLVIGGIPQYSGAAHLAARAALRAGAGLVSVAAPAKSEGLIKNGLPEVITLPLGEPGSRTWPDALPEKLSELLNRCDALVIGPGLGRDREAGAFLSAVLSLPGRPPAVIDADALMLLAGHARLPRHIAEDDIITPHPGEAAALLGTTAPAVQADRFAALGALCRLFPCAVILKGAGSLAGKADRPVLISPHDVPQLAVGGSGDVLAGCLGAFLAGGRSSAARASLSCAGMGIALHALAGLECAASCPGRGNTAGEIADAIPRARANATRADAAAARALHE